jgi:hypothetical protein
MVAEATPVVQTKAANRITKINIRLIFLFFISSHLSPSSFGGGIGLAKNAVKARFSTNALSSLPLLRPVLGAKEEVLMQMII